MGKSTINGHFQQLFQFTRSTISTAIFNSYFDITRGIPLLIFFGEKKLLVDDYIVRGLYSQKKIAWLYYFQWEFQDPKMEVRQYHTRPYFGGISPYIAQKHRLYSRYLQFGFLEWQLINMDSQVLDYQNPQYMKGSMIPYHQPTRVDRSHCSFQAFHK